MQLTSVNLGKVQAIDNGKTTGTTGIYKLPVDQPVRLTKDGVAGDFIADLESHGGVDQAVYIYGGADYAWWEKTLGKALEPGTFGENLTISGIETAGFSVGDRLHLGDVILEVTAPRIPCNTLSVRMDDRQFVKRFRQAERPGMYCRVIREGDVQVGMAVTCEPYSGERLTILEMFRDWYEPDRSEKSIRRFLDAPIAIRARHRYEELNRE